MKCEPEILQLLGHLISSSSLMHWNRNVKCWGTEELYSGDSWVGAFVFCCCSDDARTLSVFSSVLEVSPRAVSKAVLLLKALEEIHGLACSTF